jgi:hypothetical protein
MIFLLQISTLELVYVTASSWYRAQGPQVDLLYHVVPYSGCSYVSVLQRKSELGCMHLPRNEFSYKPRKQEDLNWNLQQEKLPDCCVLHNEILLPDLMP